MNKYDYFINHKLVARKEMMNKLKNYCLKVTNTIDIGGGFAADFAEYDEKAFNRYMREINKGIVVVFDNVTFMRRKRK